MNTKAGDQGVKATLMATVTSAATTHKRVRAGAEAATGARRRNWLGGPWWLYLLLLLGGLCMIVPFLWMLSTSFKPNPEIYTTSLIPKHPTFANYINVLEKTHFPRWFLNSLIIALVTTLSVAFFDSLTGFVLAKYNFPGKRAIFIMILSTLMVPTEMLVLPWYLMSVNNHWVRGDVTGIGDYAAGYWSIMFPGLMSGFGVFLMRQFFESLPDDLFDAARIDGVSEFGLYWRIALPSVRPAIAALCIFTFLGNWNAFLWPLIITNADTLRTIPVGISFFSSDVGSAYDLIMASASLATLPVVIVFAIFQRQIIRGIALTGLKS
jgi:multiple sugar transport system permease protein